MLKRISFFLALLVFFFCTPGEWTLATENIIENGGFESSTLLWNQGVLTEDSPRFGMQCFSFASPTQTSEAGFIHSVSYLSKISLEANSVYSLKFYIRADMTETPQLLPECRVDTSAEMESLLIRISRVTDVWQPVAVCFTADSTGAYDFTLLAESSFENATFYIDEIRLTSMDFTPPVSMDIQGRRNVTIPETGDTVCTYTPVVSDKEGNYVTVRNVTLSVTNPLPAGVSFDEERGALLVSASTPDNSSATISCSPSSSNTALSPATITIRFSKNLITNGSFDDIPLYSGWNTDMTDFSICKDAADSPYAQITTVHTDDNLYTGCLAPSPAFVLYESNMYVFRARLRSESPYETRQIQAQALSPDEKGVIHIQITDVGGSMWTDVVAAFRVSSYGIYTVQFDFMVPDSRPVYIDDIKIQAEEIAPAGIYFDTPMHIAIPAEGEINAPISYMVYDQENNPQQSEVEFSVSPENKGVSIADKTISVLSSAEQQTYTIIATLPDNPAVQSRRSIQITTESVGDGSFETTAPGQWWATADPSLLHFVSTHNGAYPSDGSLFARLTMNGAVSALMSDSIYRYDNTESYVFETDIRIIVPDIETVVTVLVDNANSDSFDDNLVVGQFTLSSSMQHIQKLFTPSEAITGRLMIAFNTPENHDQQVVLMDMVSVSLATVQASNVNISGLPYLDKNIVGKYRFSSNFGAVDSSACRWLFSNTEDGIFMPIDGQTETTLSITSDMLGKYVKFEVTPISLSGPVVGASVISSAVRIGEPIPIDSSVDNVITDDNTAETEVSIIENPTLSRGGMNVLDIRKFTVSTKHQFFDIMNHWAKNEIEILTAAGVVQGRGNGLFEPQSLITRAEFSAFLARAFELAPLYYEGQFSDVKYYNWYAGAIAVVTKYGISQGTGETTFSPELPITREEMAVMIMRAYRKTDAQAVGTNLGYTDASNISTWARQDVGEANALSLLRGLPDGSFQPKRNATRAEAAVTIKRMLTILAENN